MAIKLLTASGSTDPDSLAVGVESMPRGIASSNVALNSGVLRLTYFNADRSLTATKVRTCTGSTPAAATPTLCRVGLYTVADSGDLTLAASTASDTSLWSMALSPHETNLQAPVAIVAGQRYALGVLCVTGATAPQVLGGVTLGGGWIMRTQLPTLVGGLSGQSDLPAAIPAGSVGGSSLARVHGLFLP